MNVLTEYVISYYTILFSNAYLIESLTNTNLRGILRERGYTLAVDTDRLHEGVVLISGTDIIQLVEDNAKNRGQEFDEFCKVLLRMNSHYNRTRILNAFYEITIHYIEGLNKEKEKSLKSKLFNEDWFRVLYVLRNNASHFDNYGKQIEWIFRKKDSISWETITIKKDDIGHEIRYNDAELIRLFRYGLLYFKDNQSTFE